MKTLVLSCLVLLTSHSALAMHAYAEDSCVAKTLNATEVSFRLSNGSPGPHVLDLSQNLMATDAQKDAFLTVNTYGKDADGLLDDSVRNSALVIQPSSKEVTVSKKKLNDGCFEGEASTSVRGYKVLKVSSEVGKLLQIKKGDVLAFTCYSEFQAPVGNDCNK